MENPIKMDDLGVPLFLETPTCVWGVFLIWKVGVWATELLDQLSIFLLQMHRQLRPQWSAFTSKNMWSKWYEDDDAW